MNARKNKFKELNSSEMLEENYRDSDFVYSHRRFADPRDELHLTIEEFYLYSTLFTLRMTDGSVMVNVSLLEELIHIPFHNRVSRNRNAIRSTLIQLIEKQVYIVHDFPELYEILEGSEKERAGGIKEIGYNKLFKLTINEDYLKSEVNGRKWRGFVQIPFTELRKFNEMKDLYIYFATFANETVEGKATVSYEEWTKILGLSYKTAVKYVDEAVLEHEDHESKGVIYVQRGKFLNNSSKRREINTYSTTPFIDNKESKIRRMDSVSIVSPKSDNNDKKGKSKKNPF